MADNTNILSDGSPTTDTGSTGSGTDTGAGAPGAGAADVPTDINILNELLNINLNGGKNLKVEEILSSINPNIFNASPDFSLPVGNKLGLSKLFPFHLHLKYENTDNTSNSLNHYLGKFTDGACKNKHDFFGQCLVKDDVSPCKMVPEKDQDSAKYFTYLYTESSEGIHIFKITKCKNESHKINDTTSGSDVFEIENVYNKIKLDVYDKKKLVFKIFIKEHPLIIEEAENAEGGTYIRVNKPIYGNNFFGEFRILWLEDLNSDLPKKERCQRYKVIFDTDIYYLRPTDELNISTAPGTQLNVNVSYRDKFEDKRAYVLDLAKELYINMNFDLDPAKLPRDHAKLAIFRATEFYNYAKTYNYEEIGDKKVGFL